LIFYFDKKSTRITKMQNTLTAYIAQLTPMEQKVLQIAASHLETSFNLAKSIGYKEWLKLEQAKPQAEPKPQPEPEPIKKKTRFIIKSKERPSLL
jgi:hypothetical protein